LHTAQATWAARLQASEQAVQQLQLQTSPMEVAFGKLQTTVQDNAQQMASNLQVLEELYLFFIRSSTHDSGRTLA
jgi:hypothetical protein